MDKIRQRSNGESIDADLPLPLPRIPDDEDQSPNYQPLSPVVNIGEEEDLPNNFNELDESSGLPFGYGEEWNSLLSLQHQPLQPKPEGHYPFEEVDNRPEGELKCSTNSRSYFLSLLTSLLSFIQIQ